MRKTGRPGASSTVRRRARAVRLVNCLPGQEQAPLPSCVTLRMLTLLMASVPTRHFFATTAILFIVMIFSRHVVASSGDRLRRGNPRRPTPPTRGSEEAWGRCSLLVLFVEARGCSPVSRLLYSNLLQHNEANFNNLQCYFCRFVISIVKYVLAI